MLNKYLLNGWMTLGRIRKSQGGFVEKGHLNWSFNFWILLGKSLERKAILGKGTSLCIEAETEGCMQGSV